MAELHPFDCMCPRCFDQGPDRALDRVLGVEVGFCTHQRPPDVPFWPGLALPSQEPGRLRLVSGFLTYSCIGKKPMAGGNG